MPKSLRAEDAELFICPIADGPVKINCLCEIRFPGDPPPTRITQHVEKSTTMFFEAESDACHPSDTLTDDGEARNDFFWTIAGNCFCRHLYRKENHSHVHCDFFDVVRMTNTLLDVLLERRIDNSWNVELAAPWTGFTQFTALNAKPPDGYTWSGERLTKVHSNIKGRSFVAKTIVKYVECCSTKRRTAVGFLKNRSSIMRDS